MSSLSSEWLNRWVVSNLSSSYLSNLRVVLSVGWVARVSSLRNTMRAQEICSVLTHTTTHTIYSNYSPIQLLKHSLRTHQLLTIQTAHSKLLTTHYSNYWLKTTHYSLLKLLTSHPSSTHYPNYSLKTTHYSLPKLLTTHPSILTHQLVTSQYSCVSLLERWRSILLFLLGLYPPKGVCESRSPNVVHCRILFQKGALRLQF